MRIDNAAAFMLVLSWTLACYGAGELGSTPVGGFKSPEGGTQFTPEAGARPLNNLVFVLLDVKSPGTRGHAFRAPREGWVYVRMPKPAIHTDGRLVVTIDAEPLYFKEHGDDFEAMCYVSEGPHTITIEPGSGKVDRLEVRAIGELVYAFYGSNPHIAEMGDYTWDFLRKHCLDSFNGIIGGSKMTDDGKSVHEAEIKAWTGQGKRWYSLVSAPDDIRVPNPPQTVEGVFDYWTNTPGMQHPLMSGVWGDEFGGPYQAKYMPMWSEALRRIRADPRYADRQFFAYCPNRFTPHQDWFDTALFPFIQTLMDCDYRLAPEWYQVEGYSRGSRIINRTEDLIAEFGPSYEQRFRESFEQASPGAAMNRVVVVGLIAEPGWEDSDLYARYNFNAYLDAEMQFIATDPAFFGTRGLQGYQSAYCGEEQLRLFAKLVRHYAIEGRTDRLLKDPYVLAHLKNPDFIDGAEGWTLTPAVTGPDPTIEAKVAPGFGVLQAKYHAPEGTGDAALWTRRSADKPNTFSQTVRGLVPGKLYSLRFMTGDYQEFLHDKSQERKHAISVDIENTELIDDKCFQAVVKTGYWYAHGAYDKNNPYCMNYHQRVFRATQGTANLVFSDWTSGDAPGGPDGEELLWNFIQLQPYIE